MGDSDPEAIPTYVAAIVAGAYHEVIDAYEGTNGTYPLGLTAGRRWSRTSTPTRSSC